MIIGVYLEADPEPVFRTIDPYSLKTCPTILQSLEAEGITSDNFVTGVVTVVDRDTGVQLSFRYIKFEDFLNAMWRIRTKLPDGLPPKYKNTEYEWIEDEEVERG